MVKFLKYKDYILRDIEKEDEFFIGTIDFNNGKGMAFSEGLTMEELEKDFHNFIDVELESYREEGLIK